MTPARQQTPPSDAAQPDGSDGAGVQEPPADAIADGLGEEVVEGVVAELPVLAQRTRVPALRRPGRTLSRDRQSGSLPAVQAAAVAAGGFVAGAAVAGLVHRRARRSTALTQGSRSAAAGGRVGRALSRSARKSAREELVQIVGTSSYLVDVHLLGVPGRDR